MTECEQFPDGSRQRAICEGTANLPAYKINRYRERWGLAPLDEHEMVAYQPLPVQSSPPRRQRLPRPPRQRRVRSRSTANAPGATATGCGGCSGRKKQRALQLNNHGPGSQLIKIMDEAGVPHCQACLDLAAKMDAWGPAGCERRMEEIVSEILPRAREWLGDNKPWAHRLLSAVKLEDTALRLAIRQKVLQAIRAANAPS